MLSSTHPAAPKGRLLRRFAPLLKKLAKEVAVGELLSYLAVSLPQLVQAYLFQGASAFRAAWGPEKGRGAGRGKLLRTLLRGQIARESMPRTYYGPELDLVQPLPVFLHLHL